METSDIINQIIDEVEQLVLQKTHEYEHMVAESIEAVRLQLPDEVRQMNVEEFCQMCNDSEDFDQKFNIEFKSVEKVEERLLDSLVEESGYPELEIIHENAVQCELLKSPVIE